MKHESPPTISRRASSSSVQYAVSFALAVALLLGAAPVYAQPIFQANSATAGSEFSSAYLVQNTINGSGLPAGFDVDDVHAAYTRTNNHWTTAAGAITAGTAWATYYFDSPVALTHFHMWNHLSSPGLASNPDYGVSLFNLTLRDAGSNTLLALTNQTAIGTVNYGVAQSYQFARVTGVSEVHFQILNNQDNRGSFTGLAEVAFSDFEQPAAAVPEPQSVALVATGLLLLAGVRNRRKSTT